MEFPETSVDDKAIYDIGAQRHVETVLSLSQEIGLFEYLVENPAIIRTVAEHLSIAEVTSR